MESMTSVSRAHKRTSWPARASMSARVVPQLPAPTTPIRTLRFLSAVPESRLGAVQQPTDIDSMGVDDESGHCKSCHERVGVLGGEQPSDDRESCRGHD